MPILVRIDNEARNGGNTKLLLPFRACYKCPS